MNSILISGTASEKLAENVASSKSAELFKSIKTQFANSEIKITLPSNLSETQSAIIIQSISNPTSENFLELCLLISALKDKGFTDLQAIIPYFGYARQDKQYLPNEVVSFQVLGQILTGLGLSCVCTVDIHNPNPVSNSALKITNLSCLSYLAKQVYQNLDLNQTSEKEFAILSPDKGGISRSQIFAENFYSDPKNQELANIKKVRSLNKVHHTAAIELQGQVEGKQVLIVDDICTSGGTVLNAVEMCVANGANKVYAVIIHADFTTEALQKIQTSKLVKLFTTNTIQQTVSNLDLYDKLQVIEISQVFELFLSKAYY